MKQFIVLMSLVAVVLAANIDRASQKQTTAPMDRQSDGKSKSDPRKGYGWKHKCNATKPEGISQKDCCPGKPKALGCLSRDTCVKQCGGEQGHFPDICCITDCTFKNYTNVNHKIDANKLIDALVAQVKDKPDVWRPAIKKIVETCIADAPRLVDKMINEIANDISNVNNTNNTAQQSKSFLIKQKILNCSNSEMTITEDCIKKRLFFECPTKVSSQSCDALYQYAKTCPQFFYEKHGKNGEKDGKSEKNAQKSDDKNKSPAKQQAGKDTPKSDDKNKKQPADNKKNEKPTNAPDGKSKNEKSQANPSNDKNKNEKSPTNPPDNKNKNVPTKQPDNKNEKSSTKQPDNKNKNEKPPTKQPDGKDKNEKTTTKQPDTKNPKKN